MSVINNSDFSIASCKLQHINEIIWLKLHQTQTRLCEDFTMNINSML